MVHEIHTLENRTQIIEDKVWHYTCNSPSLKILNKYGIDPIGNKYNCHDYREVLLIPLKVYHKLGLVPTNDMNVLTIQSESLLKKLDS